MSPAVRVVVINHGRVKQALSLRGHFAEHGSALAIDSGSRLEAGEAAQFTHALPNVYYSGLVNAAVAACGDLGADDVLLLVASDVLVPDPARTLALLQSAFAVPTLGVWGPAATGATFPDLACHGTGALRAVAFVEGFCIAARLALFRAFVPVDVKVNAIGWGIDVHLAYLARTRGLAVCVDDRVLVHHAAGHGYDRSEAMAQMKRWLALHGRGARRANALLRHGWMHSPLGTQLLRFIPRRLWPALLHSGR